SAIIYSLFFFSSRRRHTRSKRDWSSDVCSSDLVGVPAAQAAAAFAGAVELVGGILLVLGLLTQAVAVLVVVVMVGAYAYVHKAAGIYAADGGWELVAVIGLAVAVFGLVGTGRYSLDALIAGRRAARG